MTVLIPDFHSLKSLNISGQRTVHIHDLSQHVEVTTFCSGPTSQHLRTSVGYEIALAAVSQVLVDSFEVELNRLLDSANQEADSRMKNWTLRWINPCYLNGVLWATDFHEMWPGPTIVPAAELPEFGKWYAQANAQNDDAEPPAPAAIVNVIVRSGELPHSVSPIQVFTKRWSVRYQPIKLAIRVDTSVV